MTMEEVKKNLRENKYKPEFLPVPPIRRYPDDHVFDETFFALCGLIII